MKQQCHDLRQYHTQYRKCPESEKDNPFNVIRKRVDSGRQKLNQRKDDHSLVFSNFSSFSSVDAGKTSNSSPLFLAVQTSPTSHEKHVNARGEHPQRA